MGKNLLDKLANILISAHPLAVSYAEQHRLPTLRSSISVPRSSFMLLAPLLALSLLVMGCKSETDTEEINPLSVSSAPQFPNDPLFPHQYYLENTGVPHAWEQIRDKRGFEVFVYIADSGASPHPDVSPRIWLPGFDATTGKEITELKEERDWHGTFVTGIMAAVPDNATGITGIAIPREVRFVPVKVVDLSEDNKRIGSDATLASGIIWITRQAEQHPDAAHIVNISLSGPAR